MSQAKDDDAKKRKYKARTRLSAADVAALASDLRQSVRGMRVSNVFDAATCASSSASSSLLVLKLSDARGKALLVVDPPARVHTTQHARPRRSSSSALSLKLRKHLRGRRVEDVAQLGADRVLALRFGAGLTLVVELYAQGNVALCEGAALADATTLAVLRRHQYADGAGRVAAHAAYPLAQVKRLPPFDAAAAAEALAKAATLRDAARTAVADVGAQLIEHALLSAGFDPSASPSAAAVDPHAFASALHRAYARVFADAGGAEETAKKEELPQQQQQQQQQQKALLLLRPGDGPKEARYFDFAPQRFAQFSQQRLAEQEIEAIEMPSFDAALDEFFTALEVAQAERQRLAQEAVAVRKLAKLEADQHERLETLRRNADASERGARAVEANLALVDRAITELRAAVASGLPWDELDSLIKQQRRADPTSIAAHVERLNLKANRVTLLLLPANYGDAEGEEGEGAMQKVDIDITLSAHGNVERLFSQRSQWLEKARKTAAVADDVVQRAKAKYARDAKAKMSASAVAAAGAAAFAQIRKRFWFERFHWFISSENLVVVSGHDAQQNEQLYRRYLRDGDIYVHADTHGAATTIIKNPSRKPVGAATLEQAGRQAVCRSGAWASKMVTSAYWVHPSQVSKSAPTGEYLTTGSFMIRGKKNFLPPHQLVMGFGILFALDPTCVAAHAGERRAPEESEAVADVSASSSSAAASEETPMAAPTQREEDWASMAESSVAPAPAPAPVSSEQMKMKEEEVDEEPTVVDSSSQKKGKQRQSAHERRQAKKKGGSASPAPESSTQQPKEEGKKKKQQQQQQQPLPPPKPKKKHRRTRNRYADQDEEDRELRMALNGHAPKQAPSQQAPPQKKDEKQQKPQQDTPKQRCFFCGSTEHYAHTCPLKQQQEIAEAERKRHAAATSAEEQLDDDESSSSSEDEDEERGAAAGSSAVSEPDKLTGQPRADDILLFAIPVCAPYEALQSYKFKVKVTPGHLKRSKAVESALQIFLRQPDITEQEKRLMQAIPSDEMLQCILSDVTIAGGQASARLASLKKKKGGKK